MHQLLIILQVNQAPNLPVNLALIHLRFHLLITLRGLLISLPSYPLTLHPQGLLLHHLMSPQRHLLILRRQLLLRVPHLPRLLFRPDLLPMHPL